MLREIYGTQYNANRWCLYESQFVIKHFLQESRKNIKIISLVREPVGRNLSSFFHNVDKFIPNCASLYEAGRIDIAAITRHYLDKFHEHSYPLTWFDDEMKSVFGIDVFSADVSASQDRRVFRYQHKDLELLIIRTEDIDDVAEGALEQFLEIEEFQLKKANLSSEKKYNRVYGDFAKSVNLPETYVTRMYESKYARYFYSDQEIERFRTRWLR
jgi:Putative capsular polysaccharide synthesis protein